jgi:hypothetical protein
MKCELSFNQNLREKNPKSSLFYVHLYDKEVTLMVKKVKNYN